MFFYSTTDIYIHCSRIPCASVPSRHSLAVPLQRVFRLFFPSSSVATTCAYFASVLFAIFACSDYLRSRAIRRIPSMRLCRQLIPCSDTIDRCTPTGTTRHDQSPNKPVQDYRRPALRLSLSWCLLVGHRSLTGGVGIFSCVVACRDSDGWLVMPTRNAYIRGVEFSPALFTFIPIIHVFLLRLDSNKKAEPISRSARSGSPCRSVTLDFCIQLCPRILDTQQ